MAPKPDLLTQVYSTASKLNFRQSTMSDNSMKEAMDVAAASTGILALAAWLPPTAALFTIIWTALRIYESPTVQKLFGKEP